MLPESKIEELKSVVETRLERRRRTNRKSVKKHREKKAMEHALLIVRAEEEVKSASTDEAAVAWRAEKERLRYKLEKIEHESISELQVRIFRHEMKLNNLIDPGDLEPGVRADDASPEVKYLLYVQWLGYLGAPIKVGESLDDLQDRVTSVWCKVKHHASYDVKKRCFDGFIFENCECAKIEAEGEAKFLKWKEEYDIEQGSAGLGTTEETAVITPCLTDSDHAKASNLIDIVAEPPKIA